MDFLSVLTLHTPYSIRTPQLAMLILYNYLTIINMVTDYMQYELRRLGEISYVLAEITEIEFEIAKSSSLPLKTIYCNL